MSRPIETHPTAHASSPSKSRSISCPCSVSRCISFYSCGGCCNLAEEMANGGRHLENGRDHYFHYPSVDIHPCPGSPCTDLIAKLPPLEGSPNRGHPVMDGWVSRLGCFGRGGSQLCRGQTFASCGAMMFLAGLLPYL
ncbi:hypothetical protein E2C01_037439 [Portunus trituberculatus]|uniref:Uncharacterized protein n=1 Tax=Portunus trituberculatus TaxID=210409 RepID=A0A5B7FE04_PORTR|nr:hypothetical protein [Portunus trituberculatus]